MRRLFRRFLRDSSGQDLIEYGLLAACISVVGILAWQSIGTTIGQKYGSWDGTTQEYASCTPNPRSVWDSQGTGCSAAWDAKFK